jgi:CcmD family protein
MNRIISVLVSLVCLAIPQLVAAQINDPQRMYTAYDMRSNGKIYVVVVVVLIILIGLILYLVRLDRKIGKLEKEIR